MARAPKLAFYSLLYLQCFLYQASGSTTNDQEVFLNGIVDLKCNSDSDCVINSTNCIDGTCQCPAGYVISGSFTSCIKVATSHGQPCSESIQCSLHLSFGGECRDAICVCAEGYYYMHGKCNAYSGLFAKCQKNDDCYIYGDYGAVICDKGTCQCDKEYYQREYRSCRPRAKAVNDSCLINNDCTFDVNALCNSDRKCELANLNITKSQSFNKLNGLLQRNNFPTGPVTKDDTINNCSLDIDCKMLGAAICGPTGICLCKYGYFLHEEENKCVQELGESCKDNDKPVIQYSRCKNGRWNCEMDRVASENNRRCQKAIRKYGYSCTSKNQCNIFGPDAICEDNKCVCNDNSWFNEEETFCWTKKNISERCDRNLDCQVEENSLKSSCINNLCTCPEDSYANSRKTACLEYSAALGRKCEKSETCVTENAECTDELCTCKTNYYQLENECLQGINSTCTEDNECKAENSKCISGKCSCMEDFIAMSTDSCVPVVSLGEPCRVDDQCSTKVPRAICLNKESNNSMCACPEGHHFNLGKCFKRRVLGMACENLGECYLDSSNNRAVCRNGKCACDEGFIRLNQTACGQNSNGVVTVSTGLLSIMVLFSNYFV